MELAVTLLIVALAAAIVARSAWRVLRGGKPGCGTGCGSCPSAPAPGTKETPLVSLDLTRRPGPSH